MNDNRGQGKLSAKEELLFIWLFKFKFGYRSLYGRTLVFRLNYYICFYSICCIVNNKKRQQNICKRLQQKLLLKYN